ncbi:unnamed protein product [Prorocentrum cordatum]|uniref:VTT domain-containing protein n=1 Tax=Prorocentrum cordatum TaxID=2364126 RepID=A0ABN9VB96_9DINO|nr:unnamed protein product [Polarella glacialis]
MMPAEVARPAGWGTPASVLARAGGLGGAAQLARLRNGAIGPRSVLALGVSGQIYYVLAFVLMQLTVVVPVTPFMVAAAYIWGAPWSSRAPERSYVLVSLGVIGSAACGFFLSRFVVRPQVQRIFSNRQEVQRICAAVGQQGFRVALLCRLSLVLPTAVGTFVLGALTDIRFLDFFGATLLGSVPEAWAVVYLASSVKEGVPCRTASSLGMCIWWPLWPSSCW